MTDYMVKPRHSIGRYTLISACSMGDAAEIFCRNADPGDGPVRLDVRPLNGLDDWTQFDVTPIPVPEWQAKRL